MPPLSKSGNSIAGLSIFKTFEIRIAHISSITSRYHTKREIGDDYKTHIRPGPIAGISLIAIVFVFLILVVWGRQRARAREEATMHRYKDYVSNVVALEDQQRDIRNGGYAYGRGYFPGPQYTAADDDGSERARRLMKPLPPVPGKAGRSQQQS
ncbi:hypothetical protein CCUS01_00788 [Colletotrichum cuscutae]|uniref:Uncharacterized protein n=1 Tax=Colletotrichum cuscutae TaxID=1209917 RepID=A0AAI9V4K3_9PEZI|nr:hypothetical protein CCUS01_00788 [Colletotrichum cuscutae]